MNAQTEHDHPIVWDNEHNDTLMGMDGHGHTVECAQAHVDHAMTDQWGIHDTRFVVNGIKEMAALSDPVTGEMIEMYTVASGEYQALEDNHE